MKRIGWSLIVGAALCIAGCAGDDDAGRTDDVVEPASCAQAGDDLAELSCLERAPVDEDGVVAERAASTLAADADLAACNTYSGACTGWNGCSRAVGEGWVYTVCGSFVYPWMTICNGQPTSWGHGVCLF